MVLLREKGPGPYHDDRITRILLIPGSIQFYIVVIVTFVTLQFSTDLSFSSAKLWSPITTFKASLNFFTSTNLVCRGFRYSDEFGTVSKLALDTLSRIGQTYSLQVHSIA